MSSTSFSPADAQRQQEEVRLRAAARRQALKDKESAEQVAALITIAEATQTLANVTLKKAEDAEKEALQARKRSRISLAVAIASAIATVLSVLLSFLFGMNYLP